MEENKAIMEMYRRTAELKVGSADLTGGLRHGRIHSVVHLPCCRWIRGQHTRRMRNCRPLDTLGLAGQGFLWNCAGMAQSTTCSTWKWLSKPGPCVCAARGGGGVCTAAAGEPSEVPVICAPYHAAGCCRAHMQQEESQVGWCCWPEVPHAQGGSCDIAMLMVGHMLS